MPRHLPWHIRCVKGEFFRNYLEGGLKTFFIISDLERKAIEKIKKYDCSSKNTICAFG